MIIMSFSSVAFYTHGSGFFSFYCECEKPKVDSMTVSDAAGGVTTMLKKPHGVEIIAGNRCVVDLF